MAEAVIHAEGYLPFAHHCAYLCRVTSRQDPKARQRALMFGIRLIVELAGRACI